MTEDPHGTATSARSGLSRPGRRGGRDVRLFNLKYSPNLGDGLLSVALEKALAEHGFDEDSTYSVDLAARTGFGPGASSRPLLLKSIDGMPPALRRWALKVPLAAMARWRWKPHYEAGLTDARAAVIGGGNLFADMDLNFPTKLSSVLGLAAERRLPTAIYAVGVSGGWSASGLRMVRQALSKADLRYVSVRDVASKDQFDALFADATGRPADVVRDPGVLISRYVPALTRAEHRRAIGLCVTSPIAVRYHSTMETTDDELADWYVDLCRTLRREERPVVAFTNGSPEDELFLDRISHRLEASAEAGYTRRRVRTPIELALLVSEFAALVAHRMHALIAGCSYGVPLVALRWDRKVDSFMDSIGAADRVLAAEPGTAEMAASMVGELLTATPQNAAASAGIIEEAFEGVGRLAGALSDTDPAP